MKHKKPHLSLFNSNAAFFIFQKILGTPQASGLLFSASGTPLGAPGTEPPALSGTRSNGEVKSRGPRKSLIFGESGGQVQILSGPPKSFARMGSAESEVGSTAAELQVIPTFLMNAPRPLIKWSGNQPCDPSAEREVRWQEIVSPSPF